MAFVRISLMTPQPGQEGRVQELLDDLVRFYQGREGFVMAYRLAADPHAGGGRLGRVSVWENKPPKTAMERMAVRNRIAHQAGAKEYCLPGSRLGRPQSCLMAQSAALLEASAGLLAPGRTPTSNVAASVYLPWASTCPPLGDVENAGRVAA
jgi:hypothetical protein